MSLRRKLTPALLAGVTLAAALGGGVSDAPARLMREPSFALGLDIGAAMHLSNDRHVLAPGPALAVRLGREFANGLTPELVVAYARWGNGSALPTATLDHIGVLPGLRWSILGGRVRPWLAVHAGLGRMALSLAELPGTTQSDFGLALRAGVGLDVMFTKRVGAGVFVRWAKTLVGGFTGGAEVGGVWLELGAGLVLQL